MKWPGHRLIVKWQASSLVAYLVVTGQCVLKVAMAGKSRQSWVSLKLNFIPRAAKIPSSSLENQTEEQNPKNVTLNAKEKLGGSWGVSLMPFLNSFCSFISNQQL